MMIVVNSNSTRCAQLTSHPTDDHLCTFVGIGDLLGRASALGVKLASEDGGSIADVAAEL